MTRTTQPAPLPYSDQRPGSRVLVTQTSNGLSVTIPSFRYWYWAMWMTAGILVQALLTAIPLLYIFAKANRAQIAAGAPSMSFPMGAFTYLPFRLGFGLLVLWLLRHRSVIEVDREHVCAETVYFLPQLRRRRQWPRSQVDDCRPHMKGLRLTSRAGRTLATLRLPDPRDREWVCNLINRELMASPPQ